MRRIRSSIRTGALAIAASALATGALVAAPASQAVPPPAAAGTHSSVELAGIVRALDKSARIPGTAWAVDATTNQVVVSLDQTVTGAKLAKLTAVLSRFGTAVRTERVAGTFTASTSTAATSSLAAGGYLGGDHLNTRCAVGFNVRDSSGVYYFLTSGQCGNIYRTWYASDGITQVGTTVGSSFPGDDYALVRYASGITPLGAVRVGTGNQDITSAASAFVGETVKRSVDGVVRGGTVTAVNVTVNYSQGTVYGLIKTSVCNETQTLLGAPLFDGTKALGLFSGGSGNCSTGGVTFYQPVTEPLSVYGVNVY